MEDNRRREKPRDRDRDADLDMDMMGDDLRGGFQDVDKDRRMFSRKKSCWFCAKEIDPQWKDPSSYSWLVNEFGKIAPGRVSGLCTTHQRRSTSAIKRGRNLGLISYVSGRIAY